MNENRAILLTPPGPGAIAVVRLVGPGVAGFLAEHFSKPAKRNRCIHGDLRDGERVIDDPVVVLLDDTRADLNLHGGPWVVQSTLELAARAGFAHASSDEQVDFDGFEEIKVATAYEVGGRTYREWPGALVNLAEVKVHTESARGWLTDITKIRRYEDLPAAARRYVEWVEKLVGSPVVMLSVGPDRDQIIPRAGAGAALAAV